MTGEKIRSGRYKIYRYLADARTNYTVAVLNLSQEEKTAAKDRCKGKRPGEHCDVKQSPDGPIFVYCTRTGCDGTENSAFTRDDLLK